MKQYTEQLKTDTIARLRNGESVAAISEDTGVPKNTLYTWKYKARSTAPDDTTRGQAASSFNSEQKFAMVLESAPLNELEVGEYCRKNGVYAEQLKRWREVCTQANAQAPAIDRVAFREQTREIHRLNAELTRKESALAEVTALMVLEKKAQNWVARGQNPLARSV